ncbi:MAG TPA: hypothetical protein PLJ21_09890, partial [Pseudobdellovibrionaceae bacterium]|nr:hypothetical protein [Pseudobdellovibrionaceae bacterium]
VFYLVTDSKTGLKFGFFKSLTDGPWVLSVAGSQSITDWISNSALGETQIQAFLAVADKIMERLLIEKAHSSDKSSEIIVTGHSLGGGLAQAMSYYFENKRFELNLPSYENYLFTWNAFGAKNIVLQVKKILEKQGSSALDLDQFLERSIVKNYFIPGDLVSTIGTHLGETREIRDPFDFNSKWFSLFETHSIYNIQKILETCESCIQEAALKLPSKKQFIPTLGGAWLASLSHYTHNLTNDKNRVENEVANTLKALYEQAFSKVSTNKPLETWEIRTFQYLESLSDQLIQENKVIIDLHGREMLLLYLKKSREIFNAERK